MENVIYRTQIIRLGKDALETLDANFLVLFGKEVPPMIEDIVFVHDNNQLLAEPKAGDTILIDDKTFEIVEVGDMAYKNLSELGHCTLSKADKADNEILPGSILIKGEEELSADVNSIIQIIQKA